MSHRIFPLVASILVIACIGTWGRCAAGTSSDPFPPVKLPVIPSSTFNIADFGAPADGKTLATDAIVKAIDAARRGGGTVRVPAGRYLTGPFALAGKIELHLDRGATLLLINDLTTYPKTEKGGCADWITAAGCTDVAITGEGTLDGRGEPWWDKYRKRNGVAPKGLPHRPHMIRLTRCSRVLVRGVTLVNSPSFHLVPDDCEDVTIDHVTIRSPGDSPNTDAIDPSGRNFHIVDCTLDVGDDNIALKPHAAKSAGPSCENFLVERCTFLHGHGMSVGGQTPGGLRGLLVRDCSFDGTEAGIRLKASRGEGGLVQDCTYERLTMRNVKVPIYITSYYPSTPADLESQRAEPVGRTTPIWRHLRITDLSATHCPEAGRILGLPEMPVSDVVFTNVHIASAKGMRIVFARGVRFVDSSISTEKGPPLVLYDADVSGLKPGREGK